MSSLEVQARVAQLRQQQQNKADAETKAKLDTLITWEAEAIFAFENTDFINEITDKTDLYAYVTRKLLPHDIRFDKETFDCMYNPTHNCNNGRLTVKPRQKGLSRGIPAEMFHKGSPDFLDLVNVSHPHVFPVNEKGFKIKHLLDKVRYTKELKQYTEKEISRKIEENKTEQILTENRRLRQELLEEKLRNVTMKELQDKYISENPGSIFRPISSNLINSRYPCRNKQFYGEINMINGDPAKIDNWLSYIGDAIKSIQERFRVNEGFKFVPGVQYKVEDLERKNIKLEKPNMLSSFTNASIMVPAYLSSDQWSLHPADKLLEAETYYKQCRKREIERFE